MQLFQQNITLLEQATLIQDELDKLGLDTFIQYFHYPANDELVKGYNIHGVLRAPRGDGTEAMVLTAPLTLADNAFNANGIRYLLQLAKFLKKYSFWSKDIIILVTTNNAYGTYSWLQAYHGFKPDVKQGLIFDSLDTHAGSIQSAISLEFPGTEDYTSIGIFPEGINGLLPNADLVTTIILSISDPYYGSPLELHHGDHKTVGYSMTDQYLACIKRLWRFIGYQASCMPKASHALFLQYKIEAITLRGLVIPGFSQSVGAIQVGQILENALRSFNNLLEKLHHSYWFYFMPTASEFIPISVYIAPVAILASSIIIFSIGKWWETPFALIASKNLKIDQSASSIYVHRVLGVTSFTHFVRPMFLPLLTLATSFGACSWMMVNIETITYISAMRTDLFALVETTIIGLQIFLVYYIMPFVHRLAYGSGASTKTSVPAWKIVRLCCCCVLGVFLFMLAGINPSLCILVALPYVPVFLFIRPTTSKVLRIAQIVLLNLLSPPGYLLLACFLYGDTAVVAQAVKDAVFDWHFFGSQLVPFVCLLIWPLNLTAQTLVEMET
ncbi:hypothetical protein, variant [Batrachochytrium dendrobatidis JEL423]|nr:hypothetical protein, variant [Batrachochytrium dendrobatidis JEL423]